ncbi:MAG: hypothetical protein JRH07_19645 [Deltaproteobacteria bacterium]|nr:hypothetical protein [Deltaproteobacteria bacterium]
MQSIRTWSIFLREKPDVVVVTNPPIVLPLVAYLYSKVRAGRFVIDSHTGAFEGKWGKLLFLHRFLSRRAITTIVTNGPLKNTVESWGARAFVLGIEVPEFPVAGANGRPVRPCVCVVSSFADDEPLEEILCAARNVPSCDFYLTGKIPQKGKKVEILKQRPSNVILTGFLPDSQYVDLLNRADVVMVLVKRDLTLLQGASEAVAVEKPLITSDWPVLKDYFCRGALYVDNTAESIGRAVEQALLRKEDLAGEIRNLKEELRRRWYEKIGSLSSRIQRCAL